MHDALQVILDGDKTTASGHRAVDLAMMSQAGLRPTNQVLNRLRTGQRPRHHHPTAAPGRGKQRMSGTLGAAGHRAGVAHPSDARGSTSSVKVCGRRGGRPRFGGHERWRG